MKIKITEIEADARELRECQTLGDNLMKMLSRCFQNHESFDFDDGEETETNDSRFEVTE